MSSGAIDPRLEIGAKAADAAIGWTFKQTADLVVSVALFVTCVAYGTYQIVYVEPERAKQWAAAAERHSADLKAMNDANNAANAANNAANNATHEKNAASFQTTLNAAIEHGERAAQKQDQFIRELFGKQPRVEMIAPVDPGTTASKPKPGPADEGDQ